MFWYKKNYRNEEKGFTPPNFPKKNLGGFTLVELIVSMGLFTVVMLAASGALLTMIDANKKAMAIRSAMDGLGFGLEDIGREVRVGWDYQCILSAPSNWASYSAALEVPLIGGVSGCPDGGVGFKMNTSMGVILYYFDSGKIKKTYVAASGTGSYYDLDMTPDGVSVDPSPPSFYVLPASPPGFAQPYVIVNLQGTVGAGLKASLVTKFHIQTMVTARMPGNAV